MHRNLAKQKSAYVKLPLDLLNVHTGLGVGNISYLLDVFGTACNSLRVFFFFLFFFINPTCCEGITTSPRLIGKCSACHTCLPDKGGGGNGDNSPFRRARE